MGPKKVLYTIDFGLLGGGTQESIRELLAHLDNQQWVPTFLSPTSGDFITWLEQRYTVTKVGEGQAWPMDRRMPLRTLGTAVKVIRQIRQGLRRQVVDVVHANWFGGFLFSALARLLLPSCRVPIIFHDRCLGQYDRDIVAAVRMLLRPYDRIVCTTKLAAQYWQDFGVTEQQLDVVYNGTDSTVRVCTSAPQGKVISYVARLSRRKDHLTLVKIADKVCRRHPDAIFRIIGGVGTAVDDVVYEQQVRDAVKVSGLESNVLLLGQLPRPQVAQAVRDSAVVVNASLTEPFGRNVIEAMMIARPVVAFDSGGVPEIVQHGKTGFLVQPGDIDGFTDYINRLLDDPAYALQLGQAGRVRAIKVFSSESTARGVEEVYRQALGTAGG